MTLPLFESPAIAPGVLSKKLRPYQARAITDVRARVLLGVKRIICVGPTGCGKLFVLANIIRTATLPVLFVAHRKEIIDQAVQQLAGQGITHVGVIRADDVRFDPSASVQVASIATLARREKPFVGQKIIVIIDECFPAGTLVDGRPIESVSPGDLVNSFDPVSGVRRKRRVVRTFVKIPSSLVRLTIGGRYLTCTPNHRLWTRDGWVEAERSLGLGVMVGRTLLGRANPTFARVGRVEVLEPGRDGTFGGVCPNGLVYNLEVEETHTYFANGVAVSNCHRAAGDSYTDLLSHYPDAIIIGFTATPIRLDGRPLGGDLFEEMIQIATYAELLKNPEWLVAPDCFAGSQQPDVSRVRRSGSDFDEGQLGDVMHDARLEGDIVEHWLRRAHMHPVFTDKGVRVPQRLVEGERRRTILFAVNVEHSMSLANRFERAGARVAHLDGNTPEPIREAMFRDLASGQLEIITNCLVAVEGIDVPPIKCVIHARPTQSITLHRQTVGREMRPWKGIVPLLLDHAGNFDRLGCPFEDVLWSLKEKPKRAKGQEPTRKCPSCGGYVKLSCTICPHCGADLPRKEQSLAEGDGELKERQTEPEALRWAFFWRQVVMAKSKGFKPGFASALYKERYGKWPPRHWSDQISSQFASDALWQSLLERRLERKAQREEQELREEQAMNKENGVGAKSGQSQPTSAEEKALTQTIDAMDSPFLVDDRDAPQVETIDDANSFLVDEHDSPQGESPFADWLDGEGIE
jgi:DNA repair protein RadD